MKRLPTPAQMWYVFFRFRKETLAEIGNAISSRDWALAEKLLDRVRYHEANMSYYRKLCMYQSR